MAAENAVKKEHDRQGSQPESYPRSLVSGPAGRNIHRARDEKDGDAKRSAHPGGGHDHVAEGVALRAACHAQRAIGETAAPFSGRIRAVHARS
jgi:hypothetical protein